MTMDGKICKNPDCELAGINQPLSNFVLDKRHNIYSSMCRKCINQNRRLKSKDPEIIKKKAEQNKKWRFSLAKYKTYSDQLNAYYEETRRDPNNPELLQVKCKNHLCTTIWFNPTNAQVSDRLKALKFNIQCENYFYCSKECKSTCPAYKINHNDPYAIKQTKNFWNEFRANILPYELNQLVFQRDKNTCQKCGKSLADYPDLKLEVHHIYPIFLEPLFASDLWNCILLCQDCHEIIHKTNNNCKYYVIKQNKFYVDYLRKMIIDENPLFKRL